jgi:serine phosphatase RsbU (regulator of sigma subunit)
VNQLLPQSFILYKPKATVSGDFYWLGQVKEKIICAVADCTGHGVPGAFMSLLGYNMLENAVKGIQEIKPAAILDTLSEEVKKRLTATDSEETKHGMDIALISIDSSNNRLEFAGAHNSLYLVRNQEITELKADKMGIGANAKAAFSNHTLELKKGDMIYLFTDGFPDQIGGPKRKKFFYPPFKELLLQISSLDPEVQKLKLNETHNEWMGDKMDQTDDILIMGIRIS